MVTLVITMFQMEPRCDGEGCGWVGAVSDGVERGKGEAEGKLEGQGKKPSCF